MPDAVCVSIPTVIKARQESGGRRVIEVESSSESVDGEGDVIVQAGLLTSAKSFIANGVLDIDHLSEIGSRIPNLPLPPSYYRIGRPIEVKSIGKGRTSVVAELFTGDASNPAVAKSDEVWNSLLTDPPTPWRASIFGYPIDYTDCRTQKCAEFPEAKRYVVKSIDWRSLALTTRPVNDSLTETARIVTAKAFIDAYVSKSMTDWVETSTPSGDVIANMMLPPRTRDELKGAHWHEHIKRGRCPHAGGSKGNSVASFREHFTNCCGMDPFEADIKSLALMYLLKRESG